MEKEFLNQLINQSDDDSDDDQNNDSDEEGSNEDETSLNETEEVDYSDVVETEEE